MNWKVFRMERSWLNLSTILAFASSACRGRDSNTSQRPYHYANKFYDNKLIFK
jgi:hypothetical protein